MAFIFIDFYDRLMSASFSDDKRFLTLIRYVRDAVQRGDENAARVERDARDDKAICPRPGRAC